MNEHRDELKFPCTYNENKLTTVSLCMRCKESNNCDLYATMLDEAEEYNKDE